VRRARRAGLVAVTLAAAVAGCAGAASREAPVAARTAVETIHVRLPAGAADVDLYWPDTADPAPLVIVAHGFSRQRRNMSGWGRHLAAEGFVAAVPDLPAWSDHVRNGRFITELRAYLVAGDAWSRRIDASRVGLMGFSAGGLATLLAAAGEPAPAVWVGLDPVDRDGIGAKAAAHVTCRTVVLTAEPSSCNADGNARGIVAALPRGEHFAVAGAVHVDAEWPTGWMAEAVCGRSTDGKRGEFRRRATAALREALGMPAADGPREDVP
jgi:dienelactone hydrolase